MVVKNYQLIDEFRKFFMDIKGNSTFRRLGKTFSTDEHFYFLDTGTGKVAQLNETVYSILKCIFETDSFDDIFKIGL